MIQVNEEYLSFRGEIKRTRALTHGPISSLPLSAGFENEILAGQTEKKNGFHYSLYCLVGFVLVSIQDVMKLLDDNQQETESTTAEETAAMSSQ